MGLSVTAWPRFCVRNPSSPLAAESSLLTLERSFELAEGAPVAGGESSVTGTRSTWSEEMDRKGPACDSQCRFRRGSRGRSPGDSSWYTPNGS